MMKNSLPTLLRGLTLVMAIVPALATGTAPTNGTVPGPPDGLVDNATRQYRAQEGFDFLSFSVFAFEDETAAEAGLEPITELATFGLGSSSRVIDVTGELENPQGIGDSASAYKVLFEDRATSYDLLIRDGVFVHYWQYAVFGTDGAATPEINQMTPKNTRATPGSNVDVESPIDTLVGIADTWFGEERDESPALSDQLPSSDLLPEGYGSGGRQASLVTRSGSR